MSGDVQPRKRKDKKRKKDELGVEEPRGTAAIFGEGDVFMHSHHEHATGGHWCAKIIFFSLLAVLVTLVGLIILENRGLTDLEAKSVESRYSGVLEGWLEDALDDGHHDEHTLELKHHDDVGEHENVDEHSQEIDQDDEEDHDNEHEEASDHDGEIEQDDDQSNDNEDDQEDSNENDDDQEDSNENDDDQEDSNENDDDDNSEEQNLEEADEDDDEEPVYRRYVRSVEHKQGDNSNEDEDNDDDLQDVDENDSNEENNQKYGNDESLEQDDDNDQSVEENNEVNEQSLEEDDEDNDQAIEDDDDNDFNNNADDDSNEDGDNSDDEQDEIDTREVEDEEEHDDDEVDSGVEVEKLEREISDEDALSTEEPVQPESKEDDISQEDSNEATNEDDGEDEEEYLELDDIDEPPPVVEHIKVPAGKPLAEVEEDTTEKPQDTLAEEEEYEKHQEELRREKDEASNMWLKLVVGGALLVATHAVVRRATAPRDAPDEHASREETPVINRRMTLIPEEAAATAISTPVLEESVFEEEFIEKVSSAIKFAAPVKQESEEGDDVEEIEIDTKEVTAGPLIDTVDKELYSDEEDEDEEEEIVIEKEELPKPSAPIAPKVVQTKPDPEPEEELPDDVEIIDDEQLEEELEEEEEDDEDDISDVDDAELLSRLEAKYGRLPEPERPGQKHKDGGNSIEDDWPGEPSDAYWRQQLDQAEQDLRQGDWSSASRRASAQELRGSARAKWLHARALDASAEARRDNALLTRAITAYLDLLKLNERLGDNILRQITDRTLDRIRFRGSYLSAEPVYRLLIRRFPDVPDYRNNLTITYLMANRADLAEEAIKETLKHWPDDRVALAHYGFVLKTQHNRLEEAVDAFQKALKDDVGPATEPRFYYHLGDSLLLLSRYAEAHEVHKRGAALGHFLSPAQRSLYNVEGLKSRPWWDIEQTPYTKLARALEKSWKEILKEGEAARALYEKEKEGLKERGEWSQLDLFIRGQEVAGRCARAPVTCSIVRAEPAAAGCRRGQVKFSLMEAGTHVRPHVGPTNCRLRMHLGLSHTKDTYLRVDQETREWQAGRVMMFDDSFEHEVWHNGTGARLVLIVDVWHPGLAPAQRRALPAI